MTKIATATHHIAHKRAQNWLAETIAAVPKVRVYESRPVRAPLSVKVPAKISVKIGG